MVVTSDYLSCDGVLHSVDGVWRSTDRKGKICGGEWGLMRTGGHLRNAAAVTAVRTAAAAAALAFVAVKCSILDPQSATAVVLCAASAAAAATAAAATANKAARAQMHAYGTTFDAGRKFAMIKPASSHHHDPTSLRPAFFSSPAVTRSSRGLTRPVTVATAAATAAAGAGAKAGGESASVEDPPSPASRDAAVTPRAENYSQWYQDVVYCGDMAERSPVRGCMVIRPWGMDVWEAAKSWLDARIREHGAENAYFPLFIPESFLSKEAEHVDGFAKECALVTHHRLTSDPNGSGLIPDPEAKLEEPLVVRPTSETMVWYMFKRWINSHRDLPLKINQWANVVRWEMRTRPFLRTSEFLWQEGHTAHATAEGADADARDMLVNYQRLCEEVLAIPVVPGEKSPSERFAGASATYTIEACMQNGWALQAGTSHFLGQSFGTAFDVRFTDTGGKQQPVWGTSWGVSTRLIGALVMTHSDDTGLVLPPAVAPAQCVIVPIPPNKKQQKEGPEAQESVDRAVADAEAALKAAGVRVRVDAREHVRSGAKYYEWERKGVPVRVEIGPRDAAKGSAMVAWRFGGDKAPVDLADLGTTVKAGLDQTQADMLAAARARLDSFVSRIDSYDEMKSAFANHDLSPTFPGPGLFLVPWKCDTENEATIKEETRATIRCYPLKDNQPGAVDGLSCFYSGEPATHLALFGRAF